MARSVHLDQGLAGVVVATVLGAVMAAIAPATVGVAPPVPLHTVIDLRGLLLSRPAPQRRV